MAAQLSEVWGADMITRIEINFSEPIELTNDDQQQMVKIAAQICERYERSNPHRVMWPFGIGLKPTFIPMTAEQERERGIEFDESVFAVECHERENYDFSCTKCGKPQGDHRHCIVDPPAGDCEFSHQQ